MRLATGTRTPYFPDAPTAAEQADIAFGWELAKEMGVDIKYGAGVSFEFLEHRGVQIEWENFSIDSDDVDLEIEGDRRALPPGVDLSAYRIVQEALTKIDALADLRPQLEWHLIGPLQSNKTREVAQAFDWVHTVASCPVAQRLSQARGSQRPPLNVCVQVNVSGEASKSGVAPAELPALARAVAARRAWRPCRQAHSAMA